MLRIIRYLSDDWKDRVHATVDAGHMPQSLEFRAETITSPQDLLESE